MVMRMDELLNMLGNETRREILNLLSERPCYVSELSNVLNIGQKAIIEHLELMRQAGILDTQFEKVQKGRPRKYFRISQDVILEVKISPNYFYMDTLLPRIRKDVLESFPNLKKFAQELDEINQLEGMAKIEGLKILYKKLNDELERISQGKQVIEVLQTEIRESFKEEVLRKELEDILY